MVALPARDFKLQQMVRVKARLRLHCKIRVSDWLHTSKFSVILKFACDKFYILERVVTNMSMFYLLKTGKNERDYASFFFLILSGVKCKAFSQGRLLTGKGDEKEICFKI